MNKNIDILSNPKSAFWKISTPLYFLFLFNSCYSMVNLFWVSQLSHEAFFAFGVAQPLIVLISGFGDAVGVGTNSLISREIGENDLIDSSLCSRKYTKAKTNAAINEATITGKINK